MVLSASTLCTFKARLKTELFTLAYPTQDSSAASPQRFRFTSSRHVTLALYKLFLLTYRETASGAEAAPSGGKAMEVGRPSTTVTTTTSCRTTALGD